MTLTGNMRSEPAQVIFTKSSTCAVNEVTADKLRSIARKYQEAIGYDYKAAMAKCEAKRKKQCTDDDVGGDALELAAKRGRRPPKKKEK